MRVLVYEYLSGGGRFDGDAAALAELLPAGRAMRDAIATDLLDGTDCEVTVACCTRAPQVPIGATALQPQPGVDAFDFVARQAVHHDRVWLVAPETDGLLQRFARLVGAPHWVGCSADAIALAERKRATLEHLATHGIATPLAHAAGATRWVVKPDDGAGAVDTRVFSDPTAAYADLAQRLDRGAPACLEPWVEGEPLSLSLRCTHDAAELLSVNRQRIEVERDGELRYAGVEIDVLPRGDARLPVLAELAAQVHAAIPGLRGYVGIDLVWHAQSGPVAIEVNPRVTCAYIGLSAALGRRLGAELIEAAAPRAAAEPLHG